MASRRQGEGDRWADGIFSWLSSALIHAALVAGTALLTYGSLASWDNPLGDENADFAVSVDVEVPAGLIEGARDADIARYPWRDGGERSSPDSIAIKPRNAKTTRDVHSDDGLAAAAPRAQGWNTDVAAAMERAAMLRKPLLVFSTVGPAEGYICLGGHLMRSTTFADPRIADLLRRRFVVVWHNQDPTRDQRGPQAPCSAAEMAAYPEGGGAENLTIIAASDGTVLDVLKGYWSVDTFLEELEFALTLTPENRDRQLAVRLQALRRQAAQLAAEHPEEAGKRVKDSPILRRKASLQLLAACHAPGELASAGELGKFLGRLAKRPLYRVWA
jgi:hypothetical protein